MPTNSIRKKDKSVHCMLSIKHRKIRLSKTLLICEIEEKEMYWKKNLEYRILENAHKRDVKKQKPAPFFKLPLNNTKNKQNNVDISKIIPVILFVYEVVSRATSVYWPIKVCVMTKFIKDIISKIMQNMLFLFCCVILFITCWVIQT